MPRAKPVAKAGAAPVAPMRPFRRSLPMQLLRAREAVMQEFRPHLRAKNLSEQQWRVLRALIEHGAMEINALAAVCAIHAASLSRMLPQLAGRGLLTRKADPDDQRRSVIAINARGRALFEAIAPESEQIYAGIERRLGAAELQELYRLLDRVIGLLPAER
jgi:homoprotocatechuate degradation regulator HpaR